MADAAARSAKNSAKNPKAAAKEAKETAKVAKKAEKARKKASNDPADMGRIRQIIRAYQVTHEYDKALPYLEQAASRAYGRNSLWVAQWRAQALMQLKREKEARDVVANALQDLGPWFPEEVATLKAVLEGTAPA